MHYNGQAKLKGKDRECPSLCVVLTSHWDVGTSSIMIRVTEFHPVKAFAAFFPTQLPTLIPTRTVPLGIPSQYPPIWATLWMFVSVLPWFRAICIRPSMARGLRHSTPLKVKNHLEQQPRQKAILMSPLYSTFKAVLSESLLKTQSYKNGNKDVEIHQNQKKRKSLSIRVKE